MRLQDPENVAAELPAVSVRATTVNPVEWVREKDEGLMRLAAPEIAFRTWATRTAGSSPHAAPTPGSRP
ncbi:MAG TPA: hypothetical protein VH439_08465 [Gemmatimonadales bacterium]